MHYLICSAGSMGDHFPFFRVAMELKKRGHQVTCFAPPAFRVLIEANGLEFTPQVPQPPSKLMKNFDSEENCLKIMSHLVEPNILPLYNWIEANYEEGRMVVVASKMLPGARLAQEKLGAPLLNLVLTPHQFTTFLTQKKAAVNRLLLDRFNRIRARIDLPPLKDLFSWLPSPEGVMAGFPTWFHNREPQWPKQTTQIDFPYCQVEERDRARQKKIIDFALNGEKPFLFSMNSYMPGAEEQIRVTEDVCCKLGIRAIILTRNKSEPPIFSQNLLKIGIAMIDSLLPFLSGLYYLGGVGTFAEALRSGVPQLISPLAANQEAQINYIKKRRLGVVLERENWNEKTLTHALISLTRDPEIAANCLAEVQRRAFSDGTDALFGDFIEKFTLERIPAGMV